MRVFRTLIGLYLIFALLLSGYVSTTVIAQDDGTTVTATTYNNLNVRTQASADASLAGVLPAGTTVEVLAQFTSIRRELWLRIPFEDGEAWIAGWLVTINGDIGTVPEAEYVDPSSWIFEISGQPDMRTFIGRIVDIRVEPISWRFTEEAQQELLLGYDTYALATADIEFYNGQRVDNIVLFVYYADWDKSFFIGETTYVTEQQALRHFERARQPSAITNTLISSGFVQGVNVSVSFGHMDTSRGTGLGKDSFERLNALSIVSPQNVLQMASSQDFAPIINQPFVVPLQLGVWQHEVGSHNDTATNTLDVNELPYGLLENPETLELQEIADVWIYEANPVLPDTIGFQGEIIDITIVNDELNWSRDPQGQGMESSTNEFIFPLAIATIKFPNDTVLDNVVVMLFNGTQGYSYVVGNQWLDMAYISRDFIFKALERNNLVVGSVISIHLGHLPEVGLYPVIEYIDWLNSVAVDPQLAIEIAASEDLTPLMSNEYVVPAWIYESGN